MAEECVNECRDGSAMQNTVGIAVAGVALETVDELARGLLGPVVRAVVGDEAAVFGKWREIYIGRIVGRNGYSLWREQDRPADYGVQCDVPTLSPVEQ